MKYRKDFVTNSSSSSFICDVCGDDESGFDMSYEDADMYCCVNGHTFCTEHAVQLTKEQKIKLILDNGWNERYNWREDKTTITSQEELEQMSSEQLDKFVIDSYCEVPAEICPICSMKTFLEGDIYKYLLKKFNMDKSCLEAEIRTKFDSYDAFEEYIRG